MGFTDEEACATSEETTDADEENLFHVITITIFNYYYLTLYLKPQRYKTNSLLL